MAAIHAVTVSLWVSDNVHRLTTRIAQRFSTVNNIPVTIIQDNDLKGQHLSHSHFGRYHMWDILPDDVQQVIYFDADILPLRPLPKKLPDVDFAAVSDAQNHVEDACRLWPVLANVGQYFNSGVFVAKRSTAPVFQRLLDRQTHAGGGVWPWIYDQTLFNIEVQAAVKAGEISFKLLPKTWNSLVVLDVNTNTPDPYMMHFAAMGLNHPGKMMFINKMLDYIERVERDTGYKHSKE